MKECKCNGYIGLDFVSSGPICDRCRSPISTTRALKFLLDYTQELEETVERMSQVFFALGFDTCTRCGNWKREKELLNTLDRSYCMDCWGDGIQEDCAGENDLNEDEQAKHVRSVSSYLARHLEFVKKQGVVGDRILMQYTNRDGIFKEPYKSEIGKIRR